MDDSYILGEGVDAAAKFEDSSPFRLSTTTDRTNHFSNWKLSHPNQNNNSLSIHQNNNKDSVSCTESSSGSSAEPTSLSTESNMSTSTNSYSSLKSKIKAVQDKYRKSSVTKQIKNKFSSAGLTNKSSKNGGKDSMSTFGDHSNAMSKFRSHSHGALPSLDEFTKNPEFDEDDINGIWSASQLAAKEKNNIQNTPNKTKAQVGQWSLITVRHFKKFSALSILCEINFWPIFNMADFEVVIWPKLISRKIWVAVKILHFTHCGKDLFFSRRESKL